jgi:hypothetical protein
MVFHHVVDEPLELIVKRLDPLALATKDGLAILCHAPDHS